MNTRIGFIISPPMESFVREITADLKYQCSYSIYVAQEPFEAYQHYTEHLDDVDLFIFSGKMFLYNVSVQEGTYRKPCFSLDGPSTNVRDILLELLMQDRNVDFSRVFIDVAYSDYNYLGLKELLPPDQMPFFLDMGVPELEEIKESAFGLETLDQFNEYVYQQHLKLYKAGAIDLSITRLGTLIPHFERTGIPYRYIHASRDYITYFIGQCLERYRSNEYSRNIMGAFVVRFPASETESVQEYITLSEQNFLKYSSSAGTDCTITKTADSLEVVFPADELYALTDHLQNLTVMEKVLHTSASISSHGGIGFGKTIMEARFNAYTASAMSRGHHNWIYCITEDGKVSGPLGKDSVTIQEEPDERLRTLAARFETDHRNLQKIISFTRVSNTRIVTSEDISRYLQITRRSGNRILNKIVEHGGATIYKDNMNGGKGRPKNCYELHFLDEL